MSLINRGCVVCHRNNYIEVFDQPTESIIGIGDIGYHHKIQICRDCGFVFAAPVLPEEMILSFYEKMSNYEHPQSQGVRPQSEKNQIHRYVDLICQRFPAGFKGKALDIGCATAYGLSLFKERGWDVVGLDPSPKCVELSKKFFNVRVIKGFFDPELLACEKLFDLIILCHVVEHLLHPDKIIKQLGQLLSDDGIVYIEVPNLMKPYAPKCYFGFEHVNFFTPVSLTNLVQSNGFLVDSLKTFDNGLEVSPFYPVIGITLKKTDQKFIMRNDYTAVIPVIENFKDGSQKLIAKLEMTINRVLAATAQGRLAVWGAGIHTSQLLSETVLGKVSLACIFDNDSKKEGSTINGYPVKKFNGDVVNLKREIDAILISSEASENDIFEQIRYLEDEGIRIYRLYH